MQFTVIETLFKLFRNHYFFTFCNKSSNLFSNTFINLGIKHGFILERFFLYSKAQRYVNCEVNFFYMKQPVKRQIFYKKQHRTAATRRSFRKCLIFFLIKKLIKFLKDLKNDLKTQTVQSVVSVQGRPTTVYNPQDIGSFKNTFFFIKLKIESTNTYSMYNKK